MIEIKNEFNFEVFKIAINYLDQEHYFMKFLDKVIENIKKDPFLLDIILSKANIDDIEIIILKIKNLSLNN